MSPKHPICDYFEIFLHTATVIKEKIHIALFDYEWCQLEVIIASNLVKILYIVNIQMVGTYLLSICAVMAKFELCNLTYWPYTYRGILKMRIIEF